MNIELKCFDEKLIKDNLLPQRKTKGSAGYDLRMAHENVPVTIHPGKMITAHTGIGFWIKHPGVVGIVAIRSSLGFSGLVLANGIGVIDSDYQGEISVKLMNHGNRPIKIQPYDRFAQILFSSIALPTLNVVEEFSNKTDRGEGGHGSTGKK